MTFNNDAICQFYEELNKLSDSEFEDIVYGADLTFEETLDTLDMMAECLENTNV